MTRLSTGVSILDRRLSGGFPEGSLAALTVPPESQSELLLYAFAKAGPTLYLSTHRPADAVEDGLERSGVDTEAITVTRCSADTLATDIHTHLRNIPDGGRLVLDAMNPIEQLTANQQMEILESIAEAVRSADAAALLHCLDEPGLEGGRVRTLSTADVVCELRLTRTSLSIDNRLYVTKFRGGAALTEPIKVKLTDGVSVDTSRDIA